jgi:DNA-binding CsgD family transcriptional regulator
MDERKLLAMIEDAYAACLEPDGWQTFVDHLSAAYGGLAALYTQDTQSLAARVSAFSGTDPAYAEQFESYYCFRNVWYQKQRRLGELMASDISESPLIRESEYYADWLRPQGLSSTIVTPVFVDGTSVANVAVLRPRSRAAFETGEIEAWKRLIPHMLRAVEIRRKMQVTGLERDSALLALDDLRVGAVLASAEGRLLLANAAAERILAGNRGLRVSGGRLHAETPAATGRLHRLIRDAAETAAGQGTAPGGTLPLPRADGTALSVSVSPVPVSRSLLAPTPMAMLLLSEAGAASPPAADALERVYDLTPAQARLLRALIDGKRLADYAGEAGLSMNTVKSHLRQIFEKTGENRQADLIRRVLANPLLQRD